MHAEVLYVGDPVQPSKELIHTTHIEVLYVGDPVQQRVREAKS